MKKSENGTPIVNQEQLIKILKNSPKGVTVLGPVGTGKTWALKHSDIQCPVTSANSISGMYASGGMEQVKKHFMYQLQGRLPLIIDDLGTEIIMGNYGTKLDVIQWLILECYNVNTKMYFSTNLSLDELTERYGTRVTDRIKEDTYIIVLEGESRREQTYQNAEEELDTILAKEPEPKPKTEAEEYHELLDGLNI
jgi:DNA replication protein DnaC